ncbi:hypothetical protein Bca52824_014318 [Brassica carinata]|uniref:PPM-type phosphatase domain-containing protein n=1 Tax=Brassica carinata TaxID=52824 RepID=A0A8X7W2P5_BRACI|nr:hypothetical protein Bca52824_014318 [Brassica carinata]
MGKGLSKQGVSGRKLLLPWKFGLEEGNVTEEVDNIRVEESVEKRRGRRKVGTVDHELVLKAMSNGFEATEQASFEMTEKALETNPELALMGSCLLVAQMRDDDVYVMNIGDSRALVAQYQVQEMGSSQHTKLVALQLTTDHSTIFLKDVSGRLQALSKHTGDEFNFESLVDEY